MNIRRYLVIFTFVPVLLALLSLDHAPLSAQEAGIGKNITVAILPFDKFDRRLTVTVIQGIILLYRKVNIVVLPSKTMPEFAFYRERKRYRADKLLDYLDSIIDTTRHTKIIALTDKEISGTKGEYYDVSVIGLARESGRTGIVSTRKLGRNKVSKSHFLKRLTKAVNQQLGRTLGLTPCDKMECLMRSSHDKAKILDQFPSQLCPACRKYIRKYFAAL